MNPLKRYILENKEITHELLISLGYKNHNCGYYCPPNFHCGLYRLEYKATQFQGSNSGIKPIQGTEEWRAYLTHSDNPTIRRFKTMRELNYFHKGMTDKYLFKPTGL